MKKTKNKNRDAKKKPSNPSERGTKHVFRVNLVQIRSAVPEIFHTQENLRWRRQKQNLRQFAACSNIETYRLNASVLGWLLIRLI